MARAPHGDEALCSQTDPALWHGGDVYVTAVRVCQRCPLIEPCREYAITHDVYGTWGGTTRKQRRRLRKELGITPISLVSEEVARDYL